MKEFLSYFHYLLEIKLCFEHEEKTLRKQHIIINNITIIPDIYDSKLIEYNLLLDVVQIDYANIHKKDRKYFVD